jgi:hypothetical protein
MVIPKTFAITIPAITSKIDDEIFVLIPITPAATTATATTAIEYRSTAIAYPFFICVVEAIGLSWDKRLMVSFTTVVISKSISF